MASERKSIISAAWDMASNSITFSVLNTGSVLLDVVKCGEEMARKAAFHGYEQKVRDAAAMSRDVKTGRSATPAEKLTAMRQVVENLHAGLWNVRAAAKAALNRACLFAAIAAVRGVSPELVASKMAAKEDSVLQTFLTHRDIAAEYSRLTAPSDSSKADEMLAELED